ncbi:hypothetical protein [Paracidovorax citrulli]
MKTIHFSTAIAITATAILTACGGGGDDAATPAAAPAETPAIPAAEGVFQGTTSTQYELGGLILDTGEYFFLYGKGNTVYGVAHGHGVSDKGSFTSSDALDFDLVTGTRTAGTISATYVPKQSIQGTVNAGGSGVSFTATYDASYDSQPPLGAMAGTYQGASAEGIGSASLTLDLASDGTLKGTSGTAPNDCKFSGKLSPRPGDKAVFDLTLQYLGGACNMGTSALSGYVLPYHTGATTRLWAVGIDRDRTNGFLAFADKTTNTGQ